MKMLLSSLLALGTLSAFAMPAITPGKYTIDPAHTRVAFEVDHMVISEVTGRFNDVKGTVTMGKKIEDMKAEATIAVASIDTGVAKRDDHLRSADFFDAGKHKEIKFVIKSVTHDEDDEFNVVGDLTMKGVTKEVKLEGEYKGVVKDSWGNQRLAMSLDGKINRKDFGINYTDSIDAGLTVGEQVEMKVIIQATMPGKK